MADGGGEYRVLVGRPQGTRPLGRPRQKWEDNAKMDLQAVGWETLTGLFWHGTGTGGGRL